MSFLAIGTFFVLALLVTLQRGPAATFAYVFLPVILLLAIVKPIFLYVLPDVSSMHAVTYGTLLGMLCAGRMPSLKLHPVDGLVLLVSVSTMATSLANGSFWTLVSSIGSETLHWLVPYYMARLAFKEPVLRKHMALILAGIAMALAFIGLIEWRLRPLFFSRILGTLGLSTVYSNLVQGRWGFFRAMTTAEHPIDYGNVGLLLMALIPSLAICGGLRLRDRRIVLGTLAAGVMAMTSMSFSTITGAAVALGLFVFLRYVRGSETLLIPAIVAIIVSGFVFTNHLLGIDLESIRPENDEAAIEGSFFTRVEIVQKSWAAFGSSAGFLGFGDNARTQAMELKSVDNSYMLFLVQRGWVHLGLRLAVMIAIAAVGMQMLRNARGERMRFPPAAAVGALVGVMISMYTVWFGFIYAVLWTCLLGMLVSMRQVMLGQMEASPVRGFEAMIAGGRAREDGFRTSPRPLVARAADAR